MLSDDGMRVTGGANSVFVLGPGGQVRRLATTRPISCPTANICRCGPCCRRSACRGSLPATSTSSPGPGPRTVDLPGWGKVGFQLCYEIIFSGEVVDRRNRPDFIFNPSNDAWFGAWGPPQHLAQARLRAAEEGLPVIRSTPTGISASIDARGRVAQLASVADAGLLSTRSLPPPAARPTFFARFGNVIPLAARLRTPHRGHCPRAGADAIGSTHKVFFI